MDSPAAAETIPAEEIPISSDRQQWSPVPPTATEEYITTQQPEQGVKACVVHQQQTIHSGPDSSYPVIGSLAENQCAALIGRNQATRWVQLIYQEQPGWMSLENLSVDGSLHDLPFIDAPLDPQSTPKYVLNEGTEVSPTTRPGNQGQSGTGDLAQVDQTFHFEYQCTSYTVQIPLDPTLDAFYSEKDKAFYYEGELPEDWREQYYQAFLTTDQDLELINQLIEKVKRELLPGQQDDLALALINLVQHLEYDCDKFFSYSQGETGKYYTNFPYETLFDQRGVCGDFSLLLVKILQQLEYGTALLLFPENNHMAAGIQCPASQANYLSGSSGYCYIETTAPFRVGVQPPLLDGKEFDETPEVFITSSGRTFGKITSMNNTRQQEVQQYGDYILYFSACEEINAYKSIKELEFGISEIEAELIGMEDQLDTLEKKLEKKGQKLDSMGCEGTVSQQKYDQCLPVYNSYEQLNNDYNYLVSRYNQVYEEYQTTFETYQQELNAFNLTLEENSSACSIVSVEPTP